MNTAYLSQIRSQSCYPAFRTFVDVATVLALILSAILGAAGIVSSEPFAMAVGVIGAGFFVLIAIVARQVSLMLVDIADATIESAGRGEITQSQKPAQSFARSESSESANQSRLPDTKQSEVALGKNHRRPENATLSNKMYCLYLAEKFEIKENEILRKFCMRSADNMFDSLNDALNAAHEIEQQEEAQANMDAKQRQAAMKKYSINLYATDRFSIPPSECLKVLKLQGFNISSGSTKNSWEISKEMESKRILLSPEELSEFTFSQMRKDFLLSG
jgi:hypothetical protein